MDISVQKFLIDTIDAISLIEEALQGTAFEDYRNDRNKMITIVQAFDSIINSVRSVPAEIKTKYPEIPWLDIEEFRNTFEPDDYGIDEEAVWKASKIRLRILKKNFLNILSI